MRWPWCLIGGCGNVINSQGHTRSHFSRYVQKVCPKGMSTLFLRIVQWSSKVVSCESIPAGPAHGKYSIPTNRLFPAYREMRNAALSSESCMCFKGRCLHHWISRWVVKNVKYVPRTELPLPRLIIFKRHPCSCFIFHRCHLNAGKTWVSKPNFQPLKGEKNMQDSQILFVIKNIILQLANFGFCSHLLHLFHFMKCSGHSDAKPSQIGWWARWNQHATYLFQHLFVIPKIPFNAKAHLGPQNQVGSKGAS